METNNTATAINYGVRMAADSRKGKKFAKGWMAQVAGLTRDANPYKADFRAVWFEGYEAAATATKETK